MLQDVPSHQADHVGPITDDGVGKIIFIITKHVAIFSISNHVTILILLTIGPGAPFSPAEPASP